MSSSTHTIFGKTSEPRGSHPRNPLLLQEPFAAKRVSRSIVSRNPKSQKAKPSASSQLNEPGQGSDGFIVNLTLEP